MCSNYMIGDARGQTMDIEVIPGQCDPIGPVGGIIVHGNHFAGSRLSVRDRSVEKWPDSLYRECRIRQVLSAHAPLIEVEHMWEALRDRFGHPNAVCRHPDQTAGRFDQLQTVASIVVDCTARECWIAVDPPDQAEYSHYTLASFGLEPEASEPNQQTTVVPQPVSASVAVPTGEESRCRTSSPRATS